MDVTIFTDGASRGNPGRGGWASVVVADNVVEVGGREDHTTNNRMELQACIGGLGALKAFKGVESVRVLTDSSYVINGITKWIKGWKRNGWKTKTKDDVVNKDLWVELSRLADDFKMKWEYVGGHVGIVGNERCDHIATSFADGNDVDLYNGPFASYDLPKILDISIDPTKAAAKKSDSSRSRAKAYSYVSSLGGVIEVHHSWAECEKRVKGMRGARYKKSLDVNDEAKVIEEFSTI